MNRFSLLLHVLYACLINLVIESISRHSFFAAWDYMVGSPWTFLFNTYLIFITFLLVYLVRRRVFVRILITAFWMILGITNGYTEYFAPGTAPTQSCPGHVVQKPAENENPSDSSEGTDNATNNSSGTTNPPSDNSNTDGNTNEEDNTDSNGNGNGDSATPPVPPTP